MPSSFHSEGYQALVALLVEIRKSKGVTQVELAAKLGRPQSYVSKIERGERRIDILEFTAWATAAGWKPLDAYKALMTRLA